MDGALNRMNQQGQDAGFAPPTNSPLVNPGSVSPTTMNTMMGSPLANSGANIMPYLSMQQAFTPKPLQGGSQASYARGGLVGFADGGMPMPDQGGAPMPQEGGAPPQGGLPSPDGGGEGDIDPSILQKVEQIFSENIQNPRAIADALLQLVMKEIRASVSPEQMKEIQTPEGQAMLKKELEKLMAQMQGGLGGQAQGGGGASPPAGGGGGLGALAGGGGGAPAGGMA